VYDSQARPVQVTFLDHTTPATVTLAYNPDGLRAEYTLAESGKTTLDERFTYRAGVLGQMQLVRGGVLLYNDTYLYTEAGAPYELLRQQGGATNRYWYAVDGRGNVVALTDINGKVVDHYAYDSWGELTSTCLGRQEIGRCETLWRLRIIEYLDMLGKSTQLLFERIDLIAFHDIHHLISMSVRRL